MNNIFSTSGILYFPTIEFQNETWVKSALTIWDTVYRIVPEGYVPKDSDEIKVAISNGFIEDIKLTEGDLRQTAEKFLLYVKSLEFIPDSFAKPDLNRRLHEGKIDKQLVPFFQEFSKTVDSKGFYNVSDEIANGYMYFLTKMVSERRNISKLTDNENTFLAMTFIDGENNFSDFVYPNDGSEVYSRVLIENLLPADIRSIPMEQIIDLHRKFANSKEQFRNEIAGFADIFPKIDDAHFATKEILRFKSRMIEHHQTRTELMKGFFKELKSSLLFVGLPTAVAALATSETENISAKALEVFGLGSIASLCDAGKEMRKGWSSQKSSYYLEVRKLLTSDEKSNLMIPNFTAMMDDFIND